MKKLILILTVALAMSPAAWAGHHHHKHYRYHDRYVYREAYPRYYYSPPPVYYDPYCQPQYDSYPVFRRAPGFSIFINPRHRHW